jgi:DNA-binding LacI/PurR family transcriptional regulator
MSDGESYKRFRWTDFSVVQLLTAREPYLALPVVRPDLFRTMRDAGQRVMDAGVLSAAILLVETDKPSITDLRMRAAASLARQDWEAKGIKDRRLLYCPPGDDNIRAFTREFAQDLPEVLVMQNNMIYWALGKNEIRVPEDLELISLTLREGDPFAGYQRNYAGLAETALNMLLEYLETDTRPPLPMPEVRVVNDTWVPGPSFPRDRLVPAGN